MLFKLLQLLLFNLHYYLSSSIRRVKENTIIFKMLKLLKLVWIAENLFREDYSKFVKKEQYIK